MTRYPKAGGMHGKSDRHPIPVGKVGPKWKRAGFEGNLGYLSGTLGVRDAIAELEDRFDLSVRCEIEPQGRGSWAYEDGEVSIGMNGLAWYSKNGYKEYATLQYLLGLRHRRGEWPRKVHGYFADPYRAGRILAGHEYAHVLTDHMLGRRWTHQVPYQLVYARVLDCLFPGFGAISRVYRRHGETISWRYPQVQEQIVAKLDQEVT